MQPIGKLPQCSNILLVYFTDLFDLQQQNVRQTPVEECNFYIKFSKLKNITPLQVFSQEKDIRYGISTFSTLTKIRVRPLVLVEFKFYFSL